MYEEQITHYNYFNADPNASNNSYREYLRHCKAMDDKANRDIDVARRKKKSELQGEMEFLSELMTTKISIEKDKNRLKAISERLNRRFKMLRYIDDKIMADICTDISYKDIRVIDIDSGYLDSDNKMEFYYAISVEKERIDQEKQRVSILHEKLNKYAREIKNACEYFNKRGDIYRMRRDYNYSELIKEAKVN